MDTYSADDPENSTTSTWSLDGDDKDAFEISDSGVLSFLAVPDYEAQTSTASLCRTRTEY